MSGTLLLLFLLLYLPKSMLQLAAGTPELQTLLCSSLPSRPTLGLIFCKRQWSGIRTAGIKRVS